MSASFHADTEFVAWLCRMGWDMAPIAQLERRMAEASLIESCLTELYSVNTRRLWWK